MSKNTEYWHCPKCKSGLIKHERLLKMTMTKKCRDCSFFLGQMGDWCENYADFKITCPNFLPKVVEKVA